MNAAGQPRKAGVVKVLLIAENPRASSHLTERLAKHGCGCEFAGSLGEATSRLQANDYDLVLSATRLPDGGAFPLMDLLEGSDATLFYFHAVEEGCWWLPGVRHGRKCFGSSALRSNEFVPVLDEAIDAIRIAPRIAEHAQPAAKQRRAVPIFSPSSSSSESLPAAAASPAPVLVKRQAAG